MPTYDKIYLANWAKELSVVRDTFEKVLRLCDILRFFDSSAEELAVSAFRELHVGAGVSRNQLDAFVMTTIDAILGSFEWIEQKHPDLVTWESEHNHD